MKWFQKIKDYFIEEEHYVEEEHNEESQKQMQPEQKQQSQVQQQEEKTPYETKKKAFRFPLDLDEPTQEQQPKREEPEHIKPTYTYNKDQNLQLPKHLQHQNVYDVEVSGIRELLESRQKSKGYSRVIRSTGEEIVQHHITVEEKKYFKQEDKPEIDPKFINPLENRKRFVPTEVPSPVYGFQKPRDIQTLLSEQPKKEDEARNRVAEKISEVEQHLQQQETKEETVQIVVHATNDLSQATYEMEEEIREVQVIHDNHAPSLSQLQHEVVEQSVVNESPEEPIEEHIENEPFFSEETNTTALTDDMHILEQSSEKELHQEAKLEPAVQHVTIENSTIHIAQMHVEQMPMQPQTTEFEAEQPMSPVKSTTGRGRLPFNVLMLKTDKQKLAARQMSEQFQFKMQKQPLVMKTSMEQEQMLEEQSFFMPDAPMANSNGVHLQPEVSVQLVDSEINVASLIEQQQPIIEQNQTDVQLANIEQQADNVEALYYEPEQTVEAPQQDEIIEVLLDHVEEIHEPQQPSTSIIEQQQQETLKYVEEPIVTEQLEDEEAAIKMVEQPVDEEPQELTNQKADAVSDTVTVQASPFQDEQQHLAVEAKPIQHYEMPPLEFLTPPEEKLEDREWMDEQGDRLVEALSYFQVQAQIESIVQGPAVTQFEITVGHGTKVSKVRNLSDDIKLALAAKDIRIDAPIPGKRSIGIEIPNRISRAVRLSEVTNSSMFKESSSPLEAALGLDLTGKPVTIDLRKMPHGLIAGATGSGKSVCINSILVSLLYKAAPHELKLMLIDPKMVELAPFNDIPHLVSPVITDVKAATAALKWAVEEMERRYQLFMHANVRDITRFNKMADEHGQYAQKLPYLLIVIDELADLMMMSPADVEEAICRIAQKARACGIHLILATQRPSVDVITGTIKSNIPTRIAFAVSSQIDSRTIIDSQGAERLLGRGDMLYLGNGSSAPVRIQGTFVTDEEIEEVIAYVRKQGEPEYIFKQDELLKKAETVEEQDELFEDVCRFVFEQGTASTSSIQRRYHIGYNRAARLVDMLERQGFVSEQKGSKPRDVFITESEIIEIFG